MENEEKQKQRLDKNEEIKETGTLNLNGNGHKANIQLLTIIGEIEGHEAVSGNTKATKYEHLIPRLAEVEDDDEVDGVLILLNTLGGDVEAGLAIAEMIASLSKPTVSLVLGGSHSIGGPLAVSADYSFIVPSGTMIVHPVRSSGMFIGVIQSYRNMEKTQDRITRFIAAHSQITKERLEESFGSVFASSACLRFSSLFFARRADASPCRRFISAYAFLLPFPRGASRERSVIRITQITISTTSTT